MVLRNKPTLHKVILNRYPIQTFIKMIGYDAHVLTSVIVSNKGLDQNYPYYCKSYKNDRICQKL